MIEVNNIKKSYGKRLILNDISFKANFGEKIVIVGRNGRGKSTLLKILSGAIVPDSGEINYFGKNPVKDSNVFKNDCGYLPQENPLIEDLSVLDNLRLWGYNKNKPDKVLLEQFELEDILKQKVSKLSGGMKRRVSLASTVIKHPKLLILDEPTAALDIYYKEDIASWLNRYQKNGGIIILTTHEEAEIQGANYCFAIKDGSLIEIDSENRSIKTILDEIINH